jgi:hypothetical protein
MSGASVADVAFLIAQRFHRAFLEPVFHRLAGAVASLITDDLDALIAAAPRVIVAADVGAYERLRRSLPRSILVWLRHGFASKNYFDGCVTACDFACVGSEWTAEMLAARGVRPHLGVWVTGFVPMDPILQGRAHLPADIAARVASGPTLLYAPTYDPALASAEVLGEDWVAPLRALLPRVNVIVKPHPLTAKRSPGWIAMWRRMAASHERVVMVEDPHDDVYRYLLGADVLLTDVSSVMFYFLALDRPIVLVSNGRRAGDPHYDSTGPEWTWRDMGTEIDRAEDLPLAVQQALEHPEQHRAQRARYRERVFGTLGDGRAAERVANRLHALVRPGPEDLSWVSTAWHAAEAMGALRQRADRLEQDLRQRVEQERRRLGRRIRRALAPLGRRARRVADVLAWRNGG